MVKNLRANAGDNRSIPGLGQSPGEGGTPHSSILAWEIPWTEEPGWLKSFKLQGAGHDLVITRAMINVNFVKILQIVQFKEKDP